MRAPHIITYGEIASSSSLTNANPAAAVVLLTTRFTFVDDQEKTEVLLSFPHTIITNALALYVTPRGMTYKTSISITNFRPPSVSCFGNFLNLFLISLVILFASIN